MRPELLVRKRMLLMTAILCLLFLLVMGRLVQLTILDADELTRRGVSQWTKEGIVTARRGTIMDCHGNVLAISASAYIVERIHILVQKVADEVRNRFSYHTRPETCISGVSLL